MANKVCWFNAAVKGGNTLVCKQMKPTLTVMVVAPALAVADRQVHVLVIGMPETTSYNGKNVLLLKWLNKRSTSK